MLICLYAYILIHIPSDGAETRESGRQTSRCIPFEFFISIACGRRPQTIADENGEGIPPGIEIIYII